MKSRRTKNKKAKPSDLRNKEIPQNIRSYFRKYFKKIFFFDIVTYLTTIKPF